ncbi:MFS transporter [Actinoallomurus rhizosphaericola]|uniref:MFS transporter n=1 Tax=Actinoallomurus rhizosphaericola TaxID=2952536 RepID=UPI0020918EF9|nr:MFS transporter [Actinoallomurus rhizosphaericola]MCO5992706.1 MFS transporter [Actinoallomurus rhizosphaericola]
MAADIDERTRRGRYAAYVAFGVQGLSFAALVTRIPELQKAHNLSDGALALVLLAVPVVAGIGSVLAGSLMTRYGSGVVLRGAQPLVLLSIVAIGVAPGDLALYGAAALFGLFVGAVDASMNAQAVTAETRYGKSLLTGFHAVWSAAGILAGLWSALANRIDLGLGTGFALPAVLGVAASLSTGHRLYPKALEATGPSVEQLKAAARRVPWKPIIIIGAAVTCMYIADSATSSYSAKYLKDDLHASGAVAPLGYVAYQICMMLSRTGADLLVRAHGAARIVGAGGLIGGVGLLTAALSPNPLVAIAGFAIAGVGLSVVVPTSFSAAGRLDPTGLGIAVSRVNVFNYAGFVLGAAIAGAVASDLWLAYLLGAALCLVVLVTARGFEPAPVDGATPNPAVAERPVA